MYKRSGPNEVDLPLPKGFAWRIHGERLILEYWKFLWQV